MAIMLLTSAAAIVLTCSALVLYELVSSSDETLEQVATLARIVSANSTAALAFCDDQDAQEVLATLRTEPSIVAAALTVGDFEGFARRGGIIRFATVGNKIRLARQPRCRGAGQAHDQLGSAPAQIVETGQD